MVAPSGGAANAIAMTAISTIREIFMFASHISN